MALKIQLMLLKKREEAEEMEKWLRALTILERNPSPILKTHIIRQLTTTHISSSVELQSPLLASWSSAYMKRVTVHTHVDRHLF